MAPKNIPTAGGLNSAVETLCGWALCAGVAYALIFLNLTGDGSLWNSLMGVAQDALPGSSAAVATRTYVLPAKPVDADTRAQDRMLMVPEQETEALVVKVEDTSRARAALTDAPADLTKSAGRADWRVHIQGQLPAFAVSGPAESSSAATARAGAAPRPTSSVKSAAATVAATTSYRAPALDAEGTPRPGIVDERSSVARVVESDGGLGNFKGAR